MAINTSNSNYVNINNLPQTQEALNGDLLILQTENGTQTIDFENFNVVKTDAEGNATVIGNLTGNDAKLDDITASTVYSNDYKVNGLDGYTATTNYYNKFTVVKGLVTSAFYVQGSPEFEEINETVLPTLTGYLNTVYKRVIDIATDGLTYLPVNVTPGATFGTVTVNNFYLNYPQVSNSALKTWHVQFFSFTGQPNTYVTRVSGMPWASAADDSNSPTLTKTGNTLSFRANLGYTNTSAENIVLYWRLLYTY